MQSTQSYDGLEQIHFLTSGEQFINNLIPLAWSLNQSDRLSQIYSVAQDIYTYLIEQIQQDETLLLYLMKRINILINQSPYYDISTFFRVFGSDLQSLAIIQKFQQEQNINLFNHKKLTKYFQNNEIINLHAILQYLSETLSVNQIESKLIVKKVLIDQLNSDDDWNEDEFTQDPHQRQKEQLNLLIMNKLSFPKLQKLISDLYIIGNQKILNLSQVQLVFPDYLKLSVCAQKQLLHRGLQDQLMITHLSILASAALENEYLINELTEIYIQQGGDQLLLKQGFNSYPETMKKMSRVYTLITTGEIINNKDAIEKLLDYQENIFSMNYYYSWSKEDVVQAILICAIIQCECTIQQILGVSNEITSINEDNLSYINRPQSVGRSQSHLELISLMLQDYFSEGVEQDNNVDVFYEGLSRLQMNENHDSENQRINFSQHFLGEPIIRNQRAILKSSHFDWSQTNMLIHDFFPKMAHKLNKRLKFVQEMTFNKVGNIACNTERFRRAIFQYSQFIFGYVNESYNYQEIKLLLPPDLQQFVTKCVLTPNLITAIDYEKIQIKFTSYDFIHIAIIVANARMYAQLMFAFRVINQL